MALMTSNIASVLTTASRFSIASVMRTTETSKVVRDVSKDLPAE